MAEPIITPILVGTAIVGFFSWIGKKTINKVGELDNRVTRLETKMDVLGDIAESLQHVRTDVEVIKSKIENLDK